MSAGVLAQGQSPPATDTHLNTERTCSLEKSWNDKGSGADLDGFFYIPVGDSSQFIIGGYGTQQKKLTGEDCVLTVAESEQLAEPIAWELIWLDRGSGARKDGSMWRAIPPGDEYRCIGAIPQIDYEKPELSNYRCVPAAYTEKVVTSAVIWTDEGSGAKKPVSIFKLPNSGSIVAVPGRLAQIETYDLKLAPVTAATAEQAPPLFEATQAGTGQAAPAAEPIPAPSAEAGGKSSKSSASVNRGSSSGGVSSSAAAKLLLQHDANVNAADESSETPLHRAPDTSEPLAQKEKPTPNNEVRSELCEGAVFTSHLYTKAGDASGRTPLHEAAATNDVATVKTVVMQHGANVNAADESSETPLHWAAWGNACKIAELLLQHGANVDARNDFSSTPLHWAARGEARETAELLFKHGANVNAKNSDGNTPLHSAALTGSREMAELLLQHGADVNAADDSGNTPLHGAALTGSREMAELLLQHGANVNARNDFSSTPLDMTKFGESTNVIPLLRSHGGK